MRSIDKPVTPCVMSVARLRWACGFSLMELLVVLGLVALLAGMAVPSFSAVLLQRQVQSAAEALVADLRLARSEAIKRGAVVSVCSSRDGQTCSAPAVWREGWIVFADRNGSRQREPDEELIRVQERAPGLASVASTQPQNDKPIFNFQPTGWARSATQTLVFTPSSTAVLSRVVCVSNQGRPTLRPAGQTTCS